MKRLRRWIFNAIVAMSLMMIAVTAILAIRSFQVADSLGWTIISHGRGDYLLDYQMKVIMVSRGGIHFESNDFEVFDVADNVEPPKLGRTIEWNHQRDSINYPWFPVLNHALSPKAKQFRGIGFEFVFDRNTQPTSYVKAITALTVPLPALIVLFAIPPLLWLRKKRRNRFTRDKSLCQACGYDLRASKDRCPECGIAIPAKAQT